jgi:hypothetical protein
MLPSNNPNKDLAMWHFGTCNLIFVVITSHFPSCICDIIGIVNASGNQKMDLMCSWTFTSKCFGGPPSFIRILTNGDGMPSLFLDLGIDVLSHISFQRSDCGKRLAIQIPAAKSPLYLTENLLGGQLLFVLWHWHVGHLSQNKPRNKNKNKNKRSTCGKYTQPFTLKFAQLNLELNNLTCLCPSHHVLSVLIQENDSWFVSHMFGPFSLFRLWNIEKHYNMDITSDSHIPTIRWSHNAKESSVV